MPDPNSIKPSNPLEVNPLRDIVMPPNRVLLKPFKKVIVKKSRINNFLRFISSPFLIVIRLASLLKNIRITPDYVSDAQNAL